MNLKEFYYDLPENLIAQYPLIKRDDAKMMVINRSTGKIKHDIFSNITKYIPDGSSVVLNDTKVIPARLLGHREGRRGKVEIFLLNELNDGYYYEVLMRPLRKLKNNDKVIFDGTGIFAQIIDWKERIVRFNKKNIINYLKKNGHIPLPPYIRRMDEPIDKKYYQTVYAKYLGSVASPTAGLHFTKTLLNKVKRQGHNVEKVTLHVNYATFKHVEENDITKHKMHTEEYQVSKKTFLNIQKAKKSGKKIIAVGTTSCRVLETIEKNKKLKGTTDLFIYPGYKFRMVDILITNFHLPYSTLLMLVYAFGSTELMKKAYTEAIKKKYRFYSYGDGMIIL